jgi:holdfast attachment protein HfaA
MARHHYLGKRTLVLTVVLAGLAVAGGAQAQSMNANSASYNAGYNRTADQENQAVNTSMRDANGNLVIVDGIIEAGDDQSVLSHSGATGAFDVVGGVGALGSSSGIGDNITVVSPSSGGNTNSNQSNNSNVRASGSLNGGVGNGQ